MEINSVECVRILMEVGVFVGICDDSGMLVLVLMVIKMFSVVSVSKEMDKFVSMFYWG